MENNWRDSKPEIPDTIWTNLPYIIMAIMIVFGLLLQYYVLPLVK